MARNSLAPGFLKIFYTAQGHAHIMVLPVNPVAPAGNATNLLDSGGASQLWTAAVADIVLFLKGLLATTDTIDTAEIWTQASPTSVPIFQASMTVGVAGTVSSTGTPYVQLRMSFRTSAGGRAVFQVMEPVFVPDTVSSAPLYGGNTHLQAVLSYISGNSSVIWGRDNHYIASGIKAVTKVNDTLRKKYLNP